MICILAHYLARPPQYNGVFKGELDAIASLQ